MRARALAADGVARRGIVFRRLSEKAVVKMGIRKSLLASVGSAMLCLALAACGSSQLGGAGGAATQPANTFEGRVPRDGGKVVDLVDKVASEGKERLSAVPSASDAAKQDDTQKTGFAAANEAYRKGDYATAETQYRKVLDKNAVHYGANVNLVLALLQLDRADEAFEQALMCVYLFKGSVGSAINAQVAGVAAGYDVDTVENALSLIAEAAGSNLGELVESSDHKDAYTYNLMWDRIDTWLHDKATGTGNSQDAGEAKDGTEDAKKAEDAQKAEEEAAAAMDAGMGVSATTQGLEFKDGKPTDPVAAYKRIRNELADLLEKNPDDKDIQALIAYCEAAGEKIGAEGDEAATSNDAKDNG